VERYGRKLRVVFLIDGDEQAQDIAEIPADLEHETLTFKLTDHMDISFGDDIIIKMRGDPYNFYVVRTT